MRLAQSQSVGSPLNQRRSIRVRGNVRRGVGFSSGENDCGPYVVVVQMFLCLAID